MAGALYGARGRSRSRLVRHTSRVARCVLHATCCTFRVARCMLHVPCCTLHVALWFACAGRHAAGRAAHPRWSARSRAHPHGRTGRSSARRRTRAVSASRTLSTLTALRAGARRVLLARPRPPASAPCIAPRGVAARASNRHQRELCGPSTCSRMRADQGCACPRAHGRRDCGIHSRVRLKLTCAAMQTEPAWRPNGLRRTQRCARQAADALACRRAQHTVHDTTYGTERAHPPDVHAAWRMKATASAHPASTRARPPTSAARSVQHLGRIGARTAGRGCCGRGSAWDRPYRTKAPTGAGPRRGLGLT